MTVTKRVTYALTAISAILFVLLCWVFADGLFTERFWDSDAIAESAIWTYALLALIVAAGVYQAQELPPDGVAARPAIEEATPGQVHDPIAWRLLLGNVFLAIFWLPLRFFVGREWLAAGEHKLRDSAWMDGGTALVTGNPERPGFWERIARVPDPPARPSITYDWFRDFIQYMIDHEWHSWFAKVIAIGEFLVGVGLVVGALVGIAAFFGTLMNFNFLLAGTASSNPVLFGLGVFLVLAWKIAGFWGLDRWLLPALGTPWAPGRLVPRAEASPLRRPSQGGTAV